MNNRHLRNDLSEWIIHFVHDRKYKDDLYSLAETTEMEFGSRMHIPCYFDEDGTSHDLTDKYLDEEFPIDEEAKAFDILRKIIHDGYIKSGWSFRNYSPTIYGPYSAVCFTEMPLHALIQYAKNRGDWSGYVGNYGIAFKRKELYAAGARPVIYGLSILHKEAEDDTDRNFGKGLRCLSENTGIGLSEQYRYVYTNLASPKPTDWMHEREWRWPLNKADKFSMPGMPFLLADRLDMGFTEVLIIVSTDEECEDVRQQLKNQYDSGCRNCGLDYKKSLIPAIKIISLESLSSNNVDLSRVRIEDITFYQTNVNVLIPVSENTRQRVLTAYAEAEKVCNDTINQYLKDHPGYVAPYMNWGYAYVCISEITEITQALQNERKASTFADGEYIMRIGEYHGPDVDLCALGAKAAADFLSETLGQYFYIKIQPD